MYIGLVVVPSLLISNLYETSSLNIQSMIRRVNDRGRRSSSIRIWLGSCSYVGRPR